jgi:hypothetical protein
MTGFFHSLWHAECQNLDSPAIQRLWCGIHAWGWCMTGCLRRCFLFQMAVWLHCRFLFPQGIIFLPDPCSILCHTSPRPFYPPPANMHLSLGTSGASTASFTWQGPIWRSEMMCCGALSRVHLVTEDQRDTNGTRRRPVVICSSCSQGSQVVTALLIPILRHNHGVHNSVPGVDDHRAGCIRVRRRRWAV